MLRGDELIRWEIGSQQTTTLDRITSFGVVGVPVPDERWHARRNKGQVEIRPAAGGDWKFLTSYRTAESDFTPDGKWLYYHSVDAAGKHGLYRISTAGGQPERVGELPSIGTGGGLWVSPDGQKVILEIRVAPEMWMFENFEPKQQAAR